MPFDSAGKILNTYLYNILQCEITLSKHSYCTFFSLSAFNFSVFFIHFYSTLLKTCMQIKDPKSKMVHIIIQLAMNATESADEKTCQPGDEMKAVLALETLVKSYFCSSPENACFHLSRTGITFTNGPQLDCLKHDFIFHHFYVNASRNYFNISVTLVKVCPVGVWGCFQLTEAILGKSGY